ncbi:MAG: N-acetylmuramoyl-L-alanine amidase [wastewater metagenome]|nr:N-acetylmuramoyl-L-alanine amidase [Candidatus Loosdrechtia aerotolerans]
MGKHERIIQYASLFTTAATLGVFISLSFLDDLTIGKTLFLFNPPRIDRSDPEFKIAHLCYTDVTENQWKYIVIHHSATTKGNAARFDDYHRNKRGWKYGLAYHFVIGNGTFSGDGEIEVAERWRKQIHGAHTANMDCNRIAIGICLVGDFENAGTPTSKQLDSLVRLTHYLSERYNIPLSNVILHSQVHQKGTACPGKNFPFSEFKTRLMQSVSNPDNRI